MIKERIIAQKQELDAKLKEAYIERAVKSNKLANHLIKVILQEELGKCNKICITLSHKCNKICYTIERH